MLKKNVFYKFSDEKSNLIIFALLGVFWFLCMFIFNNDNNDYGSILIIQLLMTIAYVNYKVASVKRELMEAEGKADASQNSSNTEKKNTDIYNLIGIIIMGVIVLGSVWFIVHKYLSPVIENPQF